LLQAFVMVLREGFESFLIVAIILSYLRSRGQKWLYQAVYAGIAVALLASFLAGLALIKGVNQALWEGVLGLVTIAMVGTLVIHMWRIAPRLKQDIQNHLGRFSSHFSRKWAFLGVFLFTLIMITREGMETALMLLQVRDQGVIGGILLGLAGAIAIAVLWVRYSRFINLKRFFQVTGVFLMLFMVQVAVYSFHEFSEAGIFPNSEAIHIATEPFSPVGIYGQWFPIVMVGASALWLLGAWIVDSLGPAKPDPR
jgi:high-affinity iron transporter